MTMITDCDCKQEDNYDFQDLLRVAKTAKKAVQHWEEYEVVDRDKWLSRTAEALRKVEHLL